VAEDLGADLTIDLGQADLVEAAQELTEGRGFDVTFEVTGSQQPLLIMGEVTRMSGTLVLAGFHQGEPRRVPLAHWNWMAFTLVNAHFRDPAVIMDGLTRGLRLLETGRLRLDALITHRFDLDDIAAAFEAAATKPDGFVKSVITTGRPTGVVP
jgi:threonine dehydrogenase-like Zn-dependent dehydrogenase